MDPKTPLPRFSDPPVVETVVGVEFAPLPKWEIPYFGVFWQEVANDKPNFKVRPYLDSQIETFGAQSTAKENSIQFVAAPEVRCWFEAADKRTLVQVQHNRFLFNWKKESPSDKYPHFDEVIGPEFAGEWSRFKDFVSRHQLGELKVLQCEISYINHIEIGKGWNSTADLSDVFSVWADQKSDCLPPPENVALEVRYLLPDGKGRLHVSARPALRNTDGLELIQLALTARGDPGGEDDASIRSWLDLARESVVRGFAAFTTDKMHKIWKRTQ